MISFAQQVTSPAEAPIATAPADVPSGATLQATEGVYECMYLMQMTGCDEARQVAAVVMDELLLNACIRGENYSYYDKMSRVRDCFREC